MKMIEQNGRFFRQLIPYDGLSSLKEAAEKNYLFIKLENDFHSFPLMDLLTTSYQMAYNLLYEDKCLYREIPATHHGFSGKREACVEFIKSDGKVEERKHIVNLNENNLIMSYSSCGCFVTCGENGISFEDVYDRVKIDRVEFSKEVYQNDNKFWQIVRVYETNW